MSELKPIRIGDRVTKFPAQTHNALIAGEQDRKNALAQIDDLRKPKLKSPVVIRVICQGLDAVTAPGSCVKLGDVAHEPATYAWAPYDGVVLLAYGWEAADKWEPFAILMEPAANGQVVDAVIPGAYWAKLNITDANHTHAVRPDEDGIVLVSSTYGQRIIWKESGTGEKWAIVRLEDSEVRYQLAVVQNVVSAGTGTYAGTVDSSYTIHDGSTVSLYLLTADTGMLAGQKVESTSLVTALDIRRDGEAKVGDVVRVWTASGVPVLPGSGTAADTFCDVLNVGDYLRGLDNYTLADDQVLTHDTTTGELAWMAQADLPGGGGGGGGTTYTAACNMTLTGTAFSVNVSSLAGQGLELQDNSPACPSLKTISNVFPGILKTASLAGATQGNAGVWTGGGAAATAFTIGGGGKIVEGHDLIAGPAVKDVVNWKRRIIRKDTNLLLATDRYDNHWVIGDDQETDIRIGVADIGGISAADVTRFNGLPGVMRPGTGNVRILSAAGNGQWVQEQDVQKLVDLADGVTNPTTEPVFEGEFVAVHVDRDGTAWATPLVPGKQRFFSTSNAIEAAHQNPNDSGLTASEFEAELMAVDENAGKLKSTGIAITVRNWTRDSVSEPTAGKVLYGKVEPADFGTWNLVIVYCKEGNV